MNTVLLVITLVSAVTAIVALVSARRVRRTEHERSEARAAALARAADTHGTVDGGWMSVAGEWQWVSEPASGHGESGFGVNEAAHGAPGIPATDRMRNPEAPIAERDATIASNALFGTVQRDETPGNRLPLFAAAALIAMLGGALVFLNTAAWSDRSATASRVNHTEPLELLSLGHARDISALTITGTIRNPASGIKVEGLTAVISLLDRGGALVSTKDVPLDYRALGPGEEAPFQVSIPDPGSIARYRVSFRAGTDVVPHVDRRTNTKLASARQ